MARTSKSRGASGFKMKSGNKTAFKMMGSSSPIQKAEVYINDELISTGDSDIDMKRALEQEQKNVYTRNRNVADNKKLLDDLSAQEDALAIDYENKLFDENADQESPEMKALQEQRSKITDQISDIENKDIQSVTYTKGDAKQRQAMSEGKRLNHNRVRDLMEGDPGFKGLQHTQEHTDEKFGPGTTVIHPKYTTAEKDTKDIEARSAELKKLRDANIDATEGGPIEKKGYFKKK